MTSAFSVITPALGLTSGASFGPGFVRPLTFAPVAAGNGLSYRLDGAETVRPMVVTATLTASGAVANRQPFLAVLDDDANIVYRVPQVAATVAGSVTLLQWLIDSPGPYVGATGDLIAPLPSLLLFGGYRFFLSAFNLDVADAFTGGRAYMECYPAGPAAYPVGSTRLYAEET